MEHMEIIAREVHKHLGGVRGIGVFHFDRGSSIQLETPMPNQTSGTALIRLVHHLEKNGFTPMISLKEARSAGTLPLSHEKGIVKLAISRRQGKHIVAISVESVDKAAVESTARKIALLVKKK